MLDLINHVVGISSRRDRTEVNALMVDALMDLFTPDSTTIHRCFGSAETPVLYACAGYDAGGRFVRNAYLPDHAHCQLLGDDPLLAQCCRELAPVIQPLPNGKHRFIFPVVSFDEALYLIEFVHQAEFSGDEKTSLQGLIEYFGNHIALLDYGESDWLTGLCSRKTFDKHLFELLGQAAIDQPITDTIPRKRRAGPKEESCHWLAVCDIDHFKSINDNHGHLIGDEVLITLSRVMRHAFRFDDYLFRFGGEEFVALLQPTDQASVHGALDRFRQSVANTAFGRAGQVTISIGYSRLLPQDTPTDVIDRADAALYYAKRNGRNRVECHEQLIAQGLLEQKHIIRDEMELF